MHFGLILGALILAVLLRLYGWQPTATWSGRWQMAMGAFLVPPILVLVAAIAVVAMGSQGTMLGLSVGWLGYSLGLGFLGIAAGSLMYGAVQGWRSQRQVQRYPVISVNNQSGRLLDVPLLFAAQVGFWHSELVVSQGLLDRLTQAQIAAILAHEGAHLHYRDTFSFFWLGWVRQLTGWLPRSAQLWQELLLLRELRADRWAAQFVDPLELAESLLLVVQAPLVDSPATAITFNNHEILSRLEERVNALLSGQEMEIGDRSPTVKWLSILTALLPLLTLPLHH